MIGVSAIGANCLKSEVMYKAHKSKFGDCPSPLRLPQLQLRDARQRLPQDRLQLGYFGRRASVSVFGVRDRSDVAAPIPGPGQCML
eukprot:COSAG06_NODE_296_length_18097_cov_302.227081_16_plen_86_part_00